MPNPKEKINKPTPEVDPLKPIAEIGEHQLVEQNKTTKAVEDLKPAIEKIAENTGTPPSFEQLVPEFFKGMRNMLIGPAGPQGEKGDAGPQGADSDVPGPVGPMGPPGPPGPRGLQGDKGDQGETGFEGLQGEAGKNGEAGAKGDKGDPGKDGTEIKAEDVRKKLESLKKGERFSYNKLDDLPDIPAIVRGITSGRGPSGSGSPVSSKDYALSELTDVNIAGATNGQVLIYDATTGKWIAGTATPPTTWMPPETPVGVVDGSNRTYTLTYVPDTYSGILDLNGERYSELTDWTISGSTITMTIAIPAVFSGLPFRFKGQYTASVTPPVVTNGLLLEDGTNMLLEDGSYLLLD